MDVNLICTRTKAWISSVVIELNLCPFARRVFSAELIRYVMQRTGLTEGTILDPFAGSGTVLYEVGSLGMAAIGVEINPAALKRFTARYPTRNWQAVRKWCAGWLRRSPRQ